MLKAVPDILARIVGQKRIELDARVHLREVLETRAAERRGERRDFRRALVERPPAVIAEIKKASPSKGVLCENFAPVEIARQYEAGGAAALSVLTDEKFFQGSLEYLEAAWGAVPLPALRKDFTLDAFHVVEAAAHGADAILLIAAILTVEQMRALRELAERFGMTALVEVHDADELAQAADAGASVIGVNNRNLRTFEVTLETSLRLAEKMPAGAVLVSESGIHSQADVSRLREAGYHAFLVGEHLMKAGDPAEALRALRA